MSEVPRPREHGNSRIRRIKDSLKQPSNRVGLGLTGMITGTAAAHVFDSPPASNIVFFTSMTYFAGEYVYQRRQQNTVEANRERELKNIVKATNNEKVQFEEANPDLYSYVGFIGMTIYDIQPDDFGKAQVEHALQGVHENDPLFKFSAFVDGAHVANHLIHHSLDNGFPNLSSEYVGNLVENLIHDLSEKKAKYRETGIDATDNYYLLEQDNILTDLDLFDKIHGIKNHVRHPKHFLTGALTFIDLYNRHAEAQSLQRDFDTE